MTDTIVTSNHKNYSRLNFLDAAKNGDLQAIKIWVEQGACTREDIEKALDRAAFSGHLAIIKYLIAQGAHPYIKKGRTLMEAAAGGQLAIVKCLIEEGVNPNAMDGDALSWALIINHTEIIKHLVDQGADLRPHLGTALMQAVSMGNLELVQYLLDKGANPNANGWEPIKEAIKHAELSGHFEILKHLVDHGAKMGSKMEKVFVVTDTDSTFIGTYSCHQKAQQVVDRMEGKFLDNDLIISEEPLDDFSMFDPLPSDEQLREMILKDGKVTLYPGEEGEIKSYDKWEDAEKALLIWKKENINSKAFICGWNPARNDLCMVSTKDLNQ